MSTTRDRILDAAETIVVRDGVARLTLEAAAGEAQLSKGGVLYHFGTRDALVSAMVERLVAAFDADLADEVTRDAAATDGSGGPETGRYVRAYIRATVRPSRTPEDVRRERTSAAILAAMASEPELLAPLRASFDLWQNCLVDDGIDPIAATVARLAVDGLWLADVFGFAPLVEPMRSEVAAYLERLGQADPAAAGQPADENGSGR